MTKRYGDDLVQLWANGCMHDPVMLQSGLSHEVCSVYACESCGSIYFGSQDGKIAYFAPDEGVDAPPSRLPIDLEAGISFIRGCLDCDGAVSAATDHGFVCRVTPSASADGTLTVRHLGFTNHPISALVPLGPSQVATIDRGRGVRLWSTSERGGTHVGDLPWPIRWTGDVRLDGEEVSLLAAASDRRTAAIRISRHGVTFTPLGVLPTAPIWADFDGDECLYTDRHCVRRSTLVDGRWEELDRLDIADVALLSIDTLYGRRLLFLCQRGGYIYSVRCDRGERARAPRRWPRLPGHPRLIWFQSLREHVVATIVLSDQRLVRSQLASPERVESALRLRPSWTGQTDEERFAHLTVSRGAVSEDVLLSYAARGGRRTTDALLQWAGKSPVPTENPEFLIGLTARLLIAASNEDIEETRDVARRTYAVCADVSAKLSDSGRDALERWLRFIHRYFLSAFIFEDKDIRLWELAERVEAQHGARAAILSARVGRRAYDVLWEREIAGAWSIDAHDGKVAVAEGNGAVWLSTNGATDQLDLQLLVPGVERSSGDNRYVSPHYSRVITFAKTAPDAPCTVVGFPRSALPDGSKLSVPAFGQQGIEGHAAQIYSVAHLNSTLLLLGTRERRTPLMTWNPRKGVVKRVELELPSGADGSPRWLTPRRILSLATGLPHGYVAIGDEDGSLHLVRWAHARFSPESLRSIPLGSSVRSLCHLAVGKRDLLAAGTEEGLLFVFDLAQLGQRTDVPIRIKFRERFRFPIRRIVLGDDGRGHSVAYVLDAGGHVTPFDVESEGPRYLGRRRRRFRPWHRGAVIEWLGNERLAFAGWDEREQVGVLRVTRPFVQSRTRVQVLGLDEARHLARKFLPSAPDDLLCAIPLHDSALRSALAKARLSTPRGGRFAELLGAARRSGALEEVKALLEATQARIAEAPEPEAQDLILSMFDEAVNPDASPKVGFDRPATRRAAVYRRLLSAAVLRRWPGRPPDERWEEHRSPERLRNWLVRALRDDDRLVCQEVARSLAQSLQQVIRESPKGSPMLPASLAARGDTDRPTVAWLLDALAPMLQRHWREGPVNDCLIDPLGWAASSVLLCLFRALPEETLSMADYLTSWGVSPAVLHLVHRRLGNQLDHEVFSRLEHYVPWEGSKPRREELLERFGTKSIERLQIAPDTMDRRYLDACRVHHKALTNLLDVRTHSDLSTVFGKHRAPVKEPSDIAPSLSPVKTWLDAVFAVLRQGEAALKIELQSHDTRLWRLAREIPGPERAAAEHVLESWEVAVMPRAPIAPPRVGHYRVGSAFKNSPTVFEVEGSPDLLMTIVIGMTASRAKMQCRAWQELQRISSASTSRLLDVVDVVDDALHPALVIRRLPGDNLTTHWREWIDLPPIERVELAMRLCTDVGTQLVHLHLGDLFHDDVVSRNIVYTGGGEARFVLVDFGRLGVARATERSHGSDTETSRENLRRQNWSQRQAADVEGLLGLVVHLLVGAPINELSRADAHRPPGGLPADHHRWAHQIIEWWRARPAPTAAEVLSSLQTIRSGESVTTAPARQRSILPPGFEDLKAAYRAKEVVAFVGAGVSAAANLPTWPALVDAMLAEIEDPTVRQEVDTLRQRDRLVDALTEISEELGAPRFHEVVAKLLNDEGREVPKLARSIAELAALHAVVTTNLDRFMERAFKGSWHTFTADAPGHLMQRRRFILKLHGTIEDPKSWVMRRSEYDGLITSIRAETLFRTLYFSRRMLFVGYGMKDDDLERTLRLIRSVFSKAPPQHFALMQRASLMRADSRNMKNMGIQVLRYEDHDDLPDILAELGA